MLVFAELVSQLESERGAGLHAFASQSCSSSVFLGCNCVALWKTDGEMLMAMYQLTSGMLEARS